MVEKSKEDKEMEEFFQAAREDAPQPPDGLVLRVLDDALSVRLLLPVDVQADQAVPRRDVSASAQSRRTVVVYVLIQRKAFDLPLRNYMHTSVA